MDSENPLQNSGHDLMGTTGMEGTIQNARRAFRALKIEDWVLIIFLVESSETYTKNISSKSEQKNTLSDFYEFFFFIFSEKKI